MKQLIRRLSRVGDSSYYYSFSGVGQKDRNRGGEVPEGHVPVYVGEELERFVVRTELLSRPVFVELLRRSAQEYGYEQRGVLRIPCAVSIFRIVMESLCNGGDENIGGEAELLTFIDANA